jgi:hypothetical protein
MGNTSNPICEVSMSATPYAARLDEACTQLLDKLYVLRRLPTITMQDCDELCRLHRDVTHSAILTERGLPPGIVELELRVHGPHYVFHSERSADDWEQAIRALQASARNAVATTASREKSRMAKGGKPPLEDSNPLQKQIYERIKRERRPREPYTKTVDRLKTDRDFVEQVREAGLRLDGKLIRNAVAFFDRRARNKQQTPTT